VFVKSYRLAQFGHGVGSRLLELITFRERNAKRETKVLGILQFIHTTVWKTLFGRAADSLERSREREDQCIWNALLNSKD
jgi:hypothetical protein